MGHSYKYTVDLYLETLKRYDETVKYYMATQINDATAKNDGGLLSPSGIVATELVAVLSSASVYFCPKSEFYRSKTMFDFLKRSYGYLCRTIRPNNTYDNHVCNFYSAPDTAFSLIGISIAYRYTLDKETDENGLAICEMLLDVIRRFADGVNGGGFHTPNHRWVECAALSLAQSILGDKKYQKRIDDLLIEGIDCNEEGEFAERSAGHYNYICDNALIIIAKEQNRPDLLQYVRKNLLMMSYYFDDEFRIFTLNSTRQDNGEMIYADKYLRLYLECGYLLQDNELLSIGKSIYQSILDNGRPIPLIFTEMARAPKIFSIPNVKPFVVKDYNKYFRGSKLIRINNGGLYATIMEDANTFFTLNYKKIDMYIKGGIHFFNERHLRVKNIVPTENGYEMTFHGEGVYYMPYGYYPGTTDYFSLDREKRDKTDVYSVDIRISVEICDKGYRITASSEGMDRVLVRFELGFRPNITVFTDNAILLGKSGARDVIHDGYVGVMASDLSHGVKIGPAFAEHFTTNGLFGSSPVNESRHNLFFEAVTPFEKSFTIEPIESVNELNLLDLK